jgi:hypothetical protein
VHQCAPPPALGGWRFRDAHNKLVAV